MSRLFLCASVLIPLLVPLLASCKTTTPACQSEIDACLARCRRTGADDNPPQTRGLPPEDTLTWCEDHCDQCHEPSSTPTPTPSAPPTYTGTAK